MRIATEVTADKLRGGFYSPQSLVRLCWDRAAALLGDRGDLHVLEPSAGDGAFFAGLAQHPLHARVAAATAVEIVDGEAAACRERLAGSPFEWEVINESVLSWALADQRRFDVAVGNPPFVRFQFVGEQEWRSTEELGRRHGVAFRGVSNLWLPVLVAALGKLCPGGAFAFIVPAECFTGVSGHEVRQWLLDHVAALHIDLFPPGSFPGVLQEVVVLSARTLDGAERPSRNVHLRQHASPSGTPRDWTHSSVDGDRTWTRFLLEPDTLEALREAAALPDVVQVGDVARFEVSTVTGANGYFCVPNDTAEEYDLSGWARPLLPRTRHARGLVFTEIDHKDLVESGLPAWLLDFSADRDDPLRRAAPARYLAQGESAQLHTRYKTRIRSPWFRVPVVAPGELLMAKRSHHFPRAIVNEAGVVTTDTIYRGRLLPGAARGTTTAASFVTGFHNSLTLLTAEVEGRSFGGGVLELVPSEISRLLVPLGEFPRADLDRLDALCRGAAGEEPEDLVAETDRIVARGTPGLSPELLVRLGAAAEHLRGLRFARNST